MRDVAIIGAGDLGGAIAYTLAQHDRIGGIRMIDDAAGVAAGKALDILQAGPVERFRARVSGTTDLAAAVAADVVILADHARPQPSEWRAESGLQLVRRLAELDRNAILLCAGAAQRELMERAAAELPFRPSQLLGSAPHALASAARALVALTVERSPADVSLQVLGAPPKHTIIAWNEATVGASSLHRLLTPQQLARLDARIATLWPPGPFALASAAASVTEAIVSGSARRFSCFVLNAELGAHGRAVALPVMVGRSGVEFVELPAPDCRERVLLENWLGSR